MYAHLYTCIYYKYIQICTYICVLKQKQINIYLIDMHAIFSFKIMYLNA